MPTAFINVMTFMALTIIPMHLNLSVGACVARPAWNVNIRQLIPAAARLHNNNCGLSVISKRLKDDGRRLEELGHIDKLPL